MRRLGPALLLALAGCAGPRNPVEPELTASQQLSNVAGAPFRLLGEALLLPWVVRPEAAPAPPDPPALDVARAIRGLSAASPAVRAAAATALAERSGELDDGARREVRPALLGLLDDPNPTVRQSAALALGRLGARGAAVQLAQMLADPEPGVRGSAALALGELGETRAGPLLDEVARSPWGEHWFVALAIVQTAGKLGVASLSDRALALLEDPPPQSGWLGPCVALAALGRLRPPGLVPRIERELDAPDPQISAAAAFALGEAGALDRLVARLGSATAPEDQLPLVLALGRHGGPAERAALVPLLGATDGRVRAHAAGALVDLGDERGVVGLIDGVQSASIYERFYCHGRLEALAGGPGPGFTQQGWRRWWEGARGRVRLGRVP